MLLKNTCTTLIFYNRTRCNCKKNKLFDKNVIFNTQNSLRFVSRYSLSAVGTCNVNQTELNFSVSSNFQTDSINSRRSSGLRRRLGWTTRMSILVSSSSSVNSSNRVVIKFTKERIQGRLLPNGRTQNKLIKIKRTYLNQISTQSDHLK